MCCRRVAAAASEAGLGGRRSLRWCGRKVVLAARAARSRARTCPWSRTVAPAPVEAMRCLARITGRTEGRPVVGAEAMSRWVEPSRTLRVTVAPCSSGGTEYRFPRKDTSA